MSEYVWLAWDHEKWTNQTSLGLDRQYVLWLCDDCIDFVMMKMMIVLMRRIWWRWWLHWWGKYDEDELENDRMKKEITMKISKVQEEYDEMRTKDDFEDY